MEINLDRYLLAHNKMYIEALEEVREGEKRGHWMWYIFPQIKGLGQSSMAKYYEIKNKEEAIAYIEEPVLRNHLLEITEELLKTNIQDIEELFCYPDDLKLQSCMTLFYLVSKNEIFKKVIDKFFNGSLDEKTIKILSEMKN